MVLTTLLLFLISFVPAFFFFRSKNYNGKLPPGPLGLPVIGQSLGLLNALKADRIDQWFHERIANHGPVWKATLFGYPTVVLHGPTANKFVYTCDGNLLSSAQPPSISRIFGPKNIIELSGNDHKRVRGAIVSFLKVEVLKQYVVKVDEEVRHHLRTHWHGKSEVQDMMGGLLSIPIRFPFTKYNRAIAARKKLVPMILDLIHEKRDALKEKTQHEDPHKDLIMSLLKVHGDDSSTMMSEEEIIDNIIAVMIAGHDTTSVLITFLVRILADNKSIYSTIAREHEEILSKKTEEEALTWEDLTKMKYTWRVASEILRIYPPASLSFRRAKQDIEYEGFIIPKGWQVLISMSMTHMDGNLFENPTMFDPSRFEKNASSPPPFSYVAFGGGPRMCPGTEFVKMETLIMINRLVTTFTWELLRKHESFSRVPLPEFDQGLLLRVKPLKQTMVSPEKCVLS